MRELKIIRPDENIDFYNDPNSYFNQFQRVGRNYTNDKFTLFREDLDVVQSFVGYIKSIELLEQYKLTRDKGIFLAGPTGCGKSAFMHILKSKQKDSEFCFITAEALSVEFMINGPKILDKYIMQYPTLCIDDIGLENNGIHFSNSINVVLTILKGRCDRNQFKTKCITHVTTKLSIEMLRIRYGGDIISILNSLFNLVLFPEDSIDKRALGL